MKILWMIYIFVETFSMLNVSSEFQGYFYRPPVKKFFEIHNQTAHKPPTGMQSDFIDDIIFQQKQQIISSLLGEASEDPNSSISASSLPFEGESKYFLNNKCATCTCGVPNVNRIVGGSRVRTNKYPWIAQMLRDSVQICGATLINDRYALTAAHCVHNMNLNHISIRLLQLDKNSANEGILRRVVFVNMHEQYNPATLEHDIALLKLDEPVPLLNPIRPVCLPNEPNQNFDFHKGIVAGWGLTSENGAPSTYLRELVVPVLTNAQCRATSYRSMILSTMLCAGYLEGGKDSCQGDSGGPLIVREGIYRLAGVVSFGYGCANANAPGVYTRVSKYLDWIAANTRDACYCIR